MLQNDFVFNSIDGCRVNRVIFSQLYSFLILGREFHLVHLINVCRGGVGLCEENKEVRFAFEVSNKGDASYKNDSNSDSSFCNNHAEYSRFIVHDWTPPYILRKHRKAQATRLPKWRLAANNRFRRQQTG